MGGDGRLERGLFREFVRCIRRVDLRRRVADESPTIPAGATGGAQSQLHRPEGGKLNRCNEMHPCMSRLLDLDPARTHWGISGVRGTTTRMQASKPARRPRLLCGKGRSGLHGGGSLAVAVVAV